ncbi:MAG: hypothetical protein NT086_08930 [Proteobacteria bacterium]|nr:hypothetical protein [Pseudomonadota bacterium]
MPQVLLKQDHIDAGKQHRAGDEVDVDESTAGWLKDNGIASDTKTKANVATKKEAE